MRIRIDVELSPGELKKTKKERSEWDNSLLPGQDLRQLR
jgi:hypothetical protein